MFSLGEPIDSPNSTRLRYSVFRETPSIPAIWVQENDREARCSICSLVMSNRGLPTRETVLYTAEYELAKSPITRGQCDVPTASKSLGHKQPDQLFRHDTVHSPSRLADHGLVKHYAGGP